MKLKINNIDKRLLEIYDLVQANTDIDKEFIKSIHNKLWVDNLPKDWGATRRDKHINKNLSYYAVNALKVKFIKNNRQASFKEGLIYVLTHPKFENYFKIGSCIDIHDRLSNYNVGCPLKEYKITAYFPTSNKFKDENELHNFFSFNKRLGEWFYKEDFSRSWVLKSIAECPNIDLIGSRY